MLKTPGASAPDDDRATRVDDLSDHGAVRRAYDDATAAAVASSGYEEDERTVEVKIVLQAVALIVALVTHARWRVAAGRLSGDGWSLERALYVLVYFALLACARSVARFWEGDALVLTRRRGADADGRAPTQSSRNERCANGLAVNVKLERYAETLSLIVTSKGDARWTRKDCVRCDARIGDYITEDGEFLDDEYERFVWKVIEAFENGKGRGADVDVSVAIAKMK